MIITTTMIIIFLTLIIITVDTVIYHNGTVKGFLNPFHPLNLYFCEPYI